MPPHSAMATRGLRYISETRWYFVRHIIGTVVTAAPVGPFGGTLQAMLQLHADMLAIEAEANEYANYALSGIEPFGNAGTDERGCPVVLVDLSIE